MEKEIWKDIVGYEGLYQISNLGNVKSLERIDKNNHIVKEKLLKNYKVSGGYLQVIFRINNIQKHYLVHRLVAEAFIPNPNNLPQVKHKDEDKTNNCASNLEYCDQCYNNNYGNRKQKVSKKLINYPKFSKIIYQIDLDTNKIIKQFPSIAEVKRQLGFGENAVRNCAKGRTMSSNGFKWQYKEIN